MDDAVKKSLKKNERVVPESEVKHFQARVLELERLAGKQAMKIDILDEAVELARGEKVDFARRLITQERYGFKLSSRLDTDGEKAEHESSFSTT